MPLAAKLALEDGSVYEGYSFGAAGETDGEVCFNTSMTGYQEILTDPSYKGQIVAMTYPEIGNYGVNGQDVESGKPQLAGFIVRELSRRYSNYRAQGDLHSYLQKYCVPGLSGIDTRALVRRLRIRGAMKGVLSTTDLDGDSLVRKARGSPGLVGRDLVRELVREVVPEASRDWCEKLNPLTKLAPATTLGATGILPISGATGILPVRSTTLEATAKSPHAPREGAAKAPHVVALDYGMKWNIARHLADRGCRVTILPGTATSDQVLAQNPDGVFLSNGPGDPEPLDYAQDTIRGLLGKKPIFGICLGHQLLGLACGAKTFKLKFGHRGANQPVLNKLTGHVEITCQNHGFAVDPESLPAELEVTHVNLNDDTIEGFRHKRVPAFSVQYHPEASAGPHDSHYLFREFVELMAKA
ncbi:MAG: glutamine-hydrolyzing carbamoyl-phosphate synthase small subunit [Planctomycetia bacterium]|nr:glutamine-hydrolyzing carbamoyl-phosphate synthase small subunit [Planctomycetia bacterium]